MFMQGSSVSVHRRAGARLKQWCFAFSLFSKLPESSLQLRKFDKQITMDGVSQYKGGNQVTGDSNLASNL